MTIETFLKQFYALRNKSPHLFSTSLENENSLYTEALAYSKNCYCVFTGGWAQDCYYSEFLIKDKDCVDCLKIEQSELCYECTDCYQCYNGDFLRNCNSTRDSRYCFGLKNCANCFLSSNQRHTSYVFKNKRYSKEKYETLVEAYCKARSPEQVYCEFIDMARAAVRINLEIINSENCLGNNISNSKNVYYGFDIVNGEDYFYAEEAGFGRDCCDIYVAGEGELFYECVGVVKKSYNCSMCINCVTCVNCELCQTCYNLNDCFGCFYMQGKKFHILNQPYSAEEFKKERNALRKGLIQSRQFNLDMFITQQI